ncbi:MAG: D-tyrosyl-tRNA(Tyr) deacylase [Clostridiales bacterium]|nr:D-tyrosyl-tRNA(Tyr) deacylase [Clostridiales bacterium]
MRVVIQRVLRASVTIDSEVTATIGKGLLVYVGIGKNDTQNDADWMVNKITSMRIFEDNEQRMNLSVKDVGGEILAVSQFTLYGDAVKGTRPSFSSAMAPTEAKAMYRYFADRLIESGIPIQEGVFAADMKVESINDGPVTIILEGKNA